MANKTTRQDFQYFEKACLSYLKAWKMDDWDVFFYHAHSKNYRAHINVNHSARQLEITLSTVWIDHPVNNRELKIAAKHEVIHGLLGPIVSLARARYVTTDEMINGEHAVVQKLMKLLPD